MELDEFEIAHPGACPIPQRDAVTRGNERVRGLAIDLARAARRKQRHAGGDNSSRPVAIHKEHACAPTVPAMYGHGLALETSRSVGQLDARAHRARVISRPVASRA